MTHGGRGLHPQSLPTKKQPRLCFSNWGPHSPPWVPFWEAEPTPARPQNLPHFCRALRGPPHCYAAPQKGLGGNPTLRVSPLRGVPSRACSGRLRLGRGHIKGRARTGLGGFCHPGVFCSSQERPPTFSEEWEEEATPVGFGETLQGINQPPPPIFCI